MHDDLKVVNFPEWLQNFQVDPITKKEANDATVSEALYLHLVIRILFKANHVMDEKDVVLNFLLLGNRFS